MSTINIGGLSLTTNTTASTNVTLNGVAIKKEDRHGTNVSKYDLNKLKLGCVAEDQLQDGQLLDHVAITDQTSIDDVYDATQIIDQIKTHLKHYDMLTTFNVVEPVKDTVSC